MYHHIFNIIAVIFMSFPFLLFLLLLFVVVLFYCCFFLLSLLMPLLLHIVFLLVSSILLHGCCCDHYYRCQSSCWCYYYCSYYIFVTNIASLLCPFLWFFDFIKFKFTSKFCNYLFGSAALFYFILQGIK